LRVLDQEYHQKCHDGRAGIYHQLPALVGTRLGGRSTAILNVQIGKSGA
jgi:hypothetical protein